MSVTVKQLYDTMVRLINNGQGDDLVVMSKDSEGNCFSPLAQVDTSHAYGADSTWSGDIKMRPEELTEQARKDGYTEADVADMDSGDWVPAILLWPTN
jgi:hypothetical protein